MLVARSSQLETRSSKLVARSSKLVARFVHKHKSRFIRTGSFYINLSGIN